MPNTAKRDPLASLCDARSPRKMAAKVAVLECLDDQSGALSLRDLMSLLPVGFAERSVRRWLAELVEEGRVVRIGRRRGTRYQAMAAPSALAASVATGTQPRANTQASAQVQAPVFSEAAIDAMAYVRRPLFQRQPVAYDVDWLAAYEPNHTTYFLAGEVAQLEAQGTRASIGDPAGTYARRIYNRLLIDLSYHSSRLEGNTYSLPDTERLVIEGRRADGKLDLETVMIINHKEAIRHLVDQSLQRGIGYDEILTLHYLLSDALVSSEHSGAVRDHGVRVGASTYMPLEDRARLQRQLHMVAEKAAAIANPYEQSLFLLIHIAYLQAFADVNKRTSRLCANIPLLRHNLVPLAFTAMAKDDYAAAVAAVYELKAPRLMAELYIASYRRTCAEYDASAEASGFDAVRFRYRSQRREAVAEIVANVAVGPVLAGQVRTAAERVPPEDRDDFVADLYEDLAALSPPRVASLGITQRQLQAWFAARKDA